MVAKAQTNNHSSNLDSENIKSISNNNKNRNNKKVKKLKKDLKSCKNVNKELEFIKNNHGRINSFQRKT